MDGVSARDVQLLDGKTLLSPAGGGEIKNEPPLFKNWIVNADPGAKQFSIFPIRKIYFAKQRNEQNQYSRWRELATSYKLHRRLSEQ